MKNLKRALSFALASVMLIGRMVVGAPYTSATAIPLSDGETWTRSFVVTGAEDNISILVADHTSG